MNKDNLNKLFELCPFNPVSTFEQDNFESQTGAGYPRYLIEVLNKIRKIDSELSHAAKAFERSCLVEERERLIALLDAQDFNQLKDALASWQDSDEDYWIEQLGKIAAIEIIANGKPSVETMTKMAKLPEDAYIKATQLCVKLANAIKAKTTQAEEEIGISPGDDSVDDRAYNMQDPNQPVKKILLKKVKE